MARAGVPCLSPAEIHRLGSQYGFIRTHCLPLLPLGAVWKAQCRYTPPPHTGKLCITPAEEYPKATALLLLVRGYRPFPQLSGLPGYYVASNEGYHGARAFCEVLKGKGYYAERLEVPLSALVQAAGIGMLCKNGLLDVGGIGTRTVLFAMVTNAALPETEEASLSTVPPVVSCGACRDCTDACPARAIDPVYGLDSRKCLRYFMEGETMPNWVMERFPGLLGCETCMACCKRNKDVTARQPTEKEQDAFDLSALLSGNTKAAQELVGKNMCSRGRLAAHGAILAAKQGRRDLLPLIAALKGHELEAVHTAATWSYDFLSK